MPVQIKVGGVWKTLTSISIKVGGVWKTVTSGKIRVGGVWKEFFASGGGGGGGGGGSLTVSVTSSLLTQNGSGMAEAGYVSHASSTTASAVGATGSVSYAWSRVSAPDPYSGGFTRLGTGATARWGATVNAEDSPHEEVWRVTATDSVGATGYADVTARLRWIDLR